MALWLRILLLGCLLWTAPALAEEQPWQLAFHTDLAKDCGDIEQVRALPAQAWLDAASMQAISPPANGVLWIRLTPSAEQLPELALVARRQRTSSWWFYGAGDSTEGRRISVFERASLDGHAPGFLVLNLPRQASTAQYACLVAPSPGPRVLALYSPAELRSAQLHQTAWLGLCLGAMLAMWTLVLAFYLGLRESVYAWYNVYVIGFAGYLLHTLDLWRQLLPVEWSGALSVALLGNGMITLCMAAGTGFALRFVPVRERFPRLAQSAKLGVALVLLGTLIHVVGVAADWPSALFGGNDLLNIGAAITILSLFSAILRLALEGQVTARIYAIGWAPLFCVVIWLILGYLGVHGGADMAPWLLLMGAGAFECLILGWGLADRARTYRQQRDLALYRAEHDALTGTLNHGALRRALQTLAAQPGEHVLLYCDLDHFKRINDEHGHAAGDRCLQRFAAIARAQLRGMDLLGRWGGEEFVAALPQAGQLEVRRVAERLRAAVAEDRDVLPMTVSIGIARRLPQESLEEWLQRADRALYRSKQNGRNRVSEDPHPAAPNPGDPHVANG